MRYATQGNGNFGDDASLEGIEHAEEGEGFGIPGQSSVGTVGGFRLSNISTQDENATEVTAPTGVDRIDLTKEPGMVGNEGLSSVSPGSLSPLINGVEGKKMSLSARIAYVMENGQPFCNHCEKHYVPVSLARLACTYCGCGRPNDDHGLTEEDFEGEDMRLTASANLEHVEGPTVADEDAGRNIIKEEIKTGSVEELLGMFKKANDSDLYHMGYNDALDGKPLDEDLALLSDDYYNGYQQHKFYNKTPQQSASQKLYDIKPNSNAIPRTDHSTIADKDAGPLQLTAKKLPFPADVIEKFFEV